MSPISTTYYSGTYIVQSVLNLMSPPPLKNKNFVLPNANPRAWGGRAKTPLFHYLNYLYCMLKHSWQ